MPPKLKQAVVDKIADALFENKSDAPRELLGKIQVVYCCNPADAIVETAANSFTKGSSAQTIFRNFVNTDINASVDLRTVTTGKTAYITDLIISNQGAAQNFTLNIGGTAVAVFSTTAGGTAGCIYNFHFNTPLVATSGQVINIGAGTNSKTVGICGWEQ